MMAAQYVNTLDRYVQTTLSFLQDLLGAYHPRDFAVRLWDGSTWETEVGQPTRFTLVLRHPGALRQMFWPPNELSFGEAYLYDDFDIEGEVKPVFAVGEHLLALPWGETEQLRYGQYLLSLPAEGRPRVGRQAAQLSGALHSKARDRQAAIYHYDVSNDFYALWLGKRMVYTCAYFATPDDELDTAQERKLDYICRKLRLRRGQRLLDIGCGWGGLLIYAAQHYGVEALGITVSQPQAELANVRIRQADLADRCRVEVLDYRDVEGAEEYDALVSVGMFEHVGEALLPTYFQQAWRLLRPGGVFLNHGIGCHPALWVHREQTFTGSYVFPDNEVLPISTTLHAAEQTGFEVRDVESLREHYVLTIGHWVRRLEAHHAEARRLTDEATYRVWRLYMSGTAYRFQTGRLNVYQALLVKPNQGKTGLPLTRADWYT
jgi:cyclopropane-fatty-acyl-phospholipid synthase